MGRRQFVKVVVLGSRGQLGAAVASGFSADGVSGFSTGGVSGFSTDGVSGFSRTYDVIALDHAALDITDADRVASTMARLSPEVIINCAGDNAVDAAEDHPVETLLANAFAVRNLARAAKACGATLVQYSSDFVFDGTAKRPYGEDERPNPRSVYAISKMLGEWFAADAPRAYVLRVESLFGRVPHGPPPRGSVAGILNGLRSGSPTRVFSDRTVSPTYVYDAVRATRELLERRAPFGLYHMVNSGACTWVEFAQEAARLLDIKPRLDAVRMADVALKAPRPLYCALSNEKLASVGIQMPAWQDALARSLRDDLADQPPNR
jgi:dTDP-4-dehydrorhamnose reductase